MTAIQTQNLQSTAAATAIAKTSQGTNGNEAQAPKADIAGQDSAVFSAEALQKAAQDQNPKGPTAQEELTDSERKEVEKLKARDREVKAHEQAHKSALGGSGGSISYSYTTGPDGNRYATGGEVPISIGESPRGAEATIQEAQKIQRAAYAPAQPSSADRAAASKAKQVEAKARQELQDKKNSGGEDGEAGASQAAVDSGASSAAGLIDTASIKAAEENGSASPLSPAGHVHTPGVECPICAAKGN